MFILGINTQVAGKYDECFREVNRFTLAICQAAIIKNLQEFIKLSEM